MPALNSMQEKEQTAAYDSACIQKSVIDGAAFLPSQGPITAFTFLNPLQGLEDLTFDEALRQVPEIFGCQPYLSEVQYRRMLKQGRISTEDLCDVLLHELSYTASEHVAGLVSRVDFRVSLLLNPMSSGSENELDWLLAETDVLRAFRAEASEGSRKQMVTESRQWIAGSTQEPADPLLRNALSRARTAEVDDPIWEEVALRLTWHYCNQGVQEVPMVLPSTPQSIRHRDQLLQQTSIDPDELVNEVLVRFCSLYLDQGYAQWRLPDRDKGFLGAFCCLYQESYSHLADWMELLPAELKRLQEECKSPEEWIADSLTKLGVDLEEMPDFIRATLLALRGWAGMIWQTEVRPDRVYIPSPPGTLLEFVAVRLLLDRLAAEFVAREELQYSGPVSGLRERLPLCTIHQYEESQRQCAYRLFQCAQINGWGPSTLSSLKRSQWKQLIQELAEFSNHERRRIFHIAFERRYARNALDAIAARVSRPRIKPEQPVLQVACCIDAREESFRRYMEEVCPDVETFGAPGFYGIPMYFRGLGDAHYTALCPIVVMPRFWLAEEPVYSMEEIARAKAKARRILGRATHLILEETNRSLGGAFVSALLGPLATVPLLGYTVFPGKTARLNTAARHFVAPPQVTRLRLERPEGVAPGPNDDQIGFTVTEMAQLGGKLLRDIGLTSNFAPIVLFLGHGSACLNNPHKSAYHCGACSGGAGGPNARALAAMLNDPRVRRILNVQGLQIPEETWFLGGAHNTGTDEITFFDLELLPSWHVQRMQRIREILQKTCELNAQERCRRFESASIDIPAAAAMVHVQDRSSNLAETRPEYGNCTNAMCVVARRERIRGLFLDRRSFLQSYDPTQDDEESSVLAGILSAVIPVCEGINLLYTFSAIDSQGWGAGSKLPHNATSMLGVMDGAFSDLRTGLPWQGVDIHEPMRLLFVIETTPERMLGIMNRNETIDRICRGGWVQLAVLDPASSEIHYFSGGRFLKYEPRSAEIATVHHSSDWCRGSRDHLPFAIIDGYVDSEST
ncbi:MAG: DUF2309 domain-containing protein [Planctomycetaceae bacterium]|nr:DUF2309 domain-containing protein [Planctomycetaceae bacterium]